MFWNRVPIFLIKLLIISIIIPSRTNSTASAHTSIFGSITIMTPRAMNRMPGMIRATPEKGFSIIPLHVSAIGHDGIGFGFAIVCSIFSAIGCPAKTHDDSGNC
jgi:hypothetical protein